MKVVKALMSLLALLAGVLVVGGWLLSPRFTVERSLTIQAPPERIYALIADPRAWARWSAWNRRDPAMAITYSGPASGAGAAWAWKSASQGDGRMTFTVAEPPGRLGYELYFPDFGTTSTGEFQLQPDGTRTRVTWTMQGDMGSNPLYRWMGLIMDRMVGPDFEAGLSGLKGLAETP